jgi:2-(1,2-epoxy-1,2-dihydrophenyl)acetyl-CoA isomerase
MRSVLAGTIEALGGDPTVPVIIVTGAGNAFSAGGDVDVLRALAAAGDVDGFRELLSEGARAVLAAACVPKPVIAAIDGPAAGAGMNLALACDVRVASASPPHEAFFAQSFAAVGLAPDWGGSHHLPALAGYGTAADLIFSAARIPARRAHELGLVDILAEDGPALPLAVARAAAYAERDGTSLAAAKRLLNAGRLPALEAALEREAAAQLELFQTPGFAARLPARPRASQETR